MKIALVFPSGHFYDTPCVPNLASYLARCGVQVDVFTAVNLGTPEGRIEHHGLCLYTFPFKLSRAKENVALLSLGFGLWLPFRLVRGSYDLVLACGIRGLFITGLIAPLVGLPYVYNSLELYSGQRYERGLRRWFKMAERFFNRRARLSIIQDSVRADFLRRINGLGTQVIGLFPNAPYQYDATGADHASDTRTRFGIPATAKLVVYSGSIHAKWAGVRQIAVAAAHFPGEYILFLQAREVTRADLGIDADSAGSNGKLVISTSPLPVAEYDQLVRDARVGVAWYESDEENIHYVGLSSGKLAHFFCRGKPVIVNRLPLYEEIFTSYQCGILVDSPEEIPDALEQIDRDYERYAVGARAVYSEMFDMRRYAEQLAEQLTTALVPAEHRF